MAREATVFPQAIGVAATFRPELNDATRRRRPLPDAGDRRPSRACRPCSTSAATRAGAGSRRRTARTRTSWPDGRRLHPRPAGRRPRRRRGRHRQALRRVRRLGGRAQLGARPPARARAPRRVPAPVRGGGARGRPGVGDERLPRARRRARAAPTAGCSTELLRGEWGFDGIVVSDYFAVRQLEEYHHVAASAARPRRWRCTPGSTSSCPAPTATPAICATRSTSGAIDDRRRRPARSRRVLTSKFRLGLFERPFVDDGRVPATPAPPRRSTSPGRSPPTASCCSSNDGVAAAAPTGIGRRDRPERRRRRATCSATTPTSPTSSRCSTCCERRRQRVRDPGRARHRRSTTDRPRPRRHGARRPARALPEATVRYAEGCGVNDDDRSGFDDAVAAAASSRRRRRRVGDEAGLTQDCTTGESRDVASLDAARRAGGARAGRRRHRHARRARARGRAPDRVARGARRGAARAAWRGCRASRAAAAIADALVGDVSPGGKLPVSYPRSSGQIPVFYGHKVSGGRSHWRGEYVDMSNRAAVPVRARPRILDVQLGPRRSTTRWSRSTTSSRWPSPSPTPADARPTRWCSSTPATRWHRSPARCASCRRSGASRSAPAPPRW